MQVLEILLNVVGPVFLIVLVGYLWARTGKGFDAQFVALIVNGVSTPCLVIDMLTRPGLTLGAVGEMALAACLVLAITAAGAFALVRASGQSIRTYAPSLIWANSGNIGLPLCLFAFGEPGLALAIAGFAVFSVSNYTIGMAIAAGGITFRQVVRMPMTWAILLAVTMMATGTQLPTVGQRTVSLLGALTVPLMLLSLGYALASLRVASYWRSVAFSLARLLGGFAVGWLVALALDLEPVARGVVVIQSAMPAAVLNYLFASRYNNDPQEVASIVVISTLLAVPLLPLFLLTVM